MTVLFSTVLTIVVTCWFRTFELGHAFEILFKRKLGRVLFRTGPSLCQLAVAGFYCIGLQYKAHQKMESTKLGAGIRRESRGEHKVETTPYTLS